MQRVTPGDYLREMNRRLKQHPDYRPGMCFTFVPHGATEDAALGYTWEPDPRVMHPYRDIAASVQAEFTT